MLRRACDGSHRGGAMAVLIGAVIGLLVGGVSFGGVGALVGFVVGVVIGIIVSARRQKDAPASIAPVPPATLASRVNALEARVAELEREIRAVARQAVVEEPVAG